MYRSYQKHLQKVRERYWKKQSDEKWVEAERIRKRLLSRKRRDSNLTKFREDERKRAKRRRKTYGIPEHIKARSILNYAIKKGWIRRPKKCPKCGTNKHRIEAHHSNYEEPLKVDWNCSRCHGKKHRIK